VVASWMRCICNAQASRRCAVCPHWGVDPELVDNSERLAG
jgi:hypothetical protein